LLTAEAAIGFQPLVDVLVEAYFDLYERHRENSPRPEAAKRLFQRWLPAIATVRPDEWDALTAEALRELAIAIRGISEPSVQLMWLDQFPATVMSYATAQLPTFPNVSVEWVTEAALDRDLFDPEWPDTEVAVGDELLPDLAAA
jgi:hypothetical protein